MESLLSLLLSTARGVGVAARDDRAEGGELVHSLLCCGEGVSLLLHTKAGLKESGSGRLLALAARW